MVYLVFLAIYRAVIARKLPKPSVSSLSRKRLENAMSNTQKFTEAKLEQAIIELLERQDYPYTRGTDLERSPSTYHIILGC